MTLISLHHCIFVLFILLIIIYKEILKNSSAEKKHKYVYFSFVCYSLRNHILQNPLCTGQAPFEIPSNSSSQKWFHMLFKQQEWKAGHMSLVWHETANNTVTTLHWRDRSPVLHTLKVSVVLNPINSHCTDIFGWTVPLTEWELSLHCWAKPMFS